MLHCPVITIMQVNFQARPQHLGRCGLGKKAELWWWRRDYLVENYDTESWSHMFPWQDSIGPESFQEQKNAGSGSHAPQRREHTAPSCSRLQRSMGSHGEKPQGSTKLRHAVRGADRQTQGSWTILTGLEAETPHGAAMCVKNQEPWYFLLALFIK